MSKKKKEQRDRYRVSFWLDVPKGDSPVSVEEAITSIVDAHLSDDEGGVKLIDAGNFTVAAISLEDV